MPPPSMDPAVYAHYERLRQNPDDAEALAALWEHHGNRGEFQQLATLVEQTAARRQDPASAADLYFRAAELWAKNLGRADRAVANYIRAFDRDPGQIAAVEAARQIYTQLGNHRQAVQLLDRQLGVTADPLVRAMLLREGAALHGQLGDPSSQIAWLDEVMQTQGDDWELLREMATALLARAHSPAAQPDDAPRAANLLAQLAQSVGGEHGVAFAETALDAWAGDEAAFAIVAEAYAAQGRGEELIARQVAFVYANPASAYTPSLRRALGEQYLSFGQVDDAIACFEPIADDDPALQRVLVGLYRQAARADDMAAMIAQLAPETEAPQRVLDLKELAEVHGQQGNRAGMLGAMREVLGIDPSDLEALALVEDDLRAQGDYAGLRDVLTEAVRSPECPADQRIPRLREIAQVSLERLDDGEAAYHAWHEVLDTSPDDADALAGLDGLLTRDGKWDELAPILARRAETLGPGSARDDALLRLANLHRDHVVDATAEAHALLTRWRATREEDLVERLTALLRAQGDTAARVEVAAHRAGAATAELAAQRWSELADAHEANNDPDAAIAAWREVERLDPAHPRAWDEVDRLMGVAGHHAARFHALVQRAESHSPGALRASLHARASDAARAMGETQTALAQAEVAVEMSPDDESLARALMDSLEALGERERLLTFVRARAARLTDGADKIELIRRAARVMGQVDPARASAVWEELRDISKRAGSGDDLEAVEAQLGLAELSGDTERVASLLVDAAALAADPEDRRGLLTRRAMMLVNELGRPAEGVAAMLAVARDVGRDHMETWSALEALVTDHPDLPVAIEAVEAQIRLADDEGIQTELASRLVARVEQDEGTASQRIHALEILHRVDAGDLGVVQRLAEMCEAEQRWADAVRYLDELAETEGDDEELSKMVQHIADLAEVQLGDPQKAWSTLLPLVAQGDIASLDHLQALASRHGLHEALVPVLVDLAGRVNDPAVKSSLWREVAARRRDHLGDLAGAFAAMQQCLRASPGSRGDLDAFDALATDPAYAGDIAAVYRGAAEASGDPTEAHDLALRGLAVIERTGAIDGALDFALSSLSRMPADEELLDAAIRLAPGRERDGDLFVALDRRRKIAQGEPERFSVTLRSLSVAGAVLCEGESAFQYLDQALGLAIGRKEPDASRLDEVEAAVRDVDAQHPEMGMVSGLVERYASLGEDASEDNPRVAAVLLRRAGALCERELALPDQAWSLYTRAVSLWPMDLDGADALEALAVESRRVPEVVALYQQVVRDAYDAEVAKLYIGRRAGLLAERLDRVDEAIEAYQKLAELSPRDLRALSALEALLARHQRWNPVLMVLERQLDAGADRAETYRRMARIWDAQLHNNFEAKDHWKKVLRHAADDPEAREALQRLERRAVITDDDLELLDASPSPAPPAPPAAPPPTATVPPAPEASPEPAMSPAPAPVTSLTPAAPVTSLTPAAPIASLFGDPLPDEVSPATSPESSLASFAALIEATGPAEPRPTPTPSAPLMAADIAEPEAQRDPRAVFFEPEPEPESAEMAAAPTTDPPAADAAPPMLVATTSSTPPGMALPSGEHQVAPFLLAPPPSIALPAEAFDELDAADAIEDIEEADLLDAAEAVEGDEVIDPAEPDDVPSLDDLAMQVEAPARPSMPPPLPRLSQPSPDNDAPRGS